MSVVLGDDVVPRLSVRSMSIFLHEFSQASVRMASLLWLYGAKRWKEAPYTLAPPGRIIHLVREHRLPKGAIPPLEMLEHPLPAHRRPSPVQEGGAGEERESSSTTSPSGEDMGQDSLTSTVPNSKLKTKTKKKDPPLVRFRPRLTLRSELLRLRLTPYSISDHLAGNYRDALGSAAEYLRDQDSGTQ
mgnify:FL=1